MAAVTLAEAQKLAPDALHSAILNALREEDPLLANLPLEYWPGGQTATYTQEATLPTTSWVVQGDAYSSTAPTRLQLTTTIKNLYTQLDEPNFHRYALGGSFDQRAANIRSMAISLSKEMRQTLMDGHVVSVAIGATATTKGIDGVWPGARHPAGLGYLDFDDTASPDTIEYMAPGDTTYGTAVSAAADLFWQVLWSGNGKDYIYIQMDVSDSAGGGDWVTTDALTGLTFSTTKQCDGLQALIWPTQWTWGTLTTAPSTNGDALTLSAMDWLKDTVPGNEDNGAYIMPKRTRRYFKTLVSTYEYADTFMGQKLHRKQLAYEGSPIFVNDYMDDQTVGTSTECKSVFYARFNAMDGLGLFYANVGGPSMRVADDTTEKEIPLPIYFRSLGELESYPQERLRLDGSIAPFLRNTQAAAEIKGITS